MILSRPLPYAIDITKHFCVAGAFTLFAIVGPTWFAKRHQYATPSSLDRATVYNNSDGQ